jgi:uncharacterized damage-inducible protein DinB
MKHFIREYGVFNLWANQRICSVVEKLSDDQLNKEIVSSFPSIQKTLLHVWDAQVVWIMRVEGISLKEFPSVYFKGTRNDAIHGLLLTSQKLKELVHEIDEASLLDDREFTTMKGVQMKSALYQIFTHVFNHGTYHRGQLVTMLRQVGVTEIPTTDLIAFYREKK